MLNKSPKHSITCLEFIAIVVMNLLLFQPILEIILPSFSYFDELFAMVSLVYLIAVTLAGRASFGWRIKQMTVLLLLIVAVGLVCNVNLNIQQNWFYVFVDVLECSKFFVVYFALRTAISDSSHFVRYMAVESKFLLILMTTCLVVNQISDIGMTYETRYGLKSFQFVFIHPTHMVTLSLCSFAFVYSEGSRNWRMYGGLALLLMAMSLRSRWIALALVIFLLMLFVKRGANKAPYLTIAAGFVGALLVGRSQFGVYYGDLSESARNQLTSAAIDIMQQLMPLGSGFGTFGSGVTKTAYSSLYYQYGLNTVYGLAPQNPCYLTDTFWPVIIAQFGLVGLLAWLLLLSVFIVDFYNYGKERGALLLSLIFIAMLLISTTSSGSIFSMQLISLVVAYVAAINAQGIRRES